MTTLPAEDVMVDGRVALIRELQPADRDALQALHDEVSDEAFRLRFFAVGRAMGTRYVDHLFSSTPETVVCLVACLEGRVVAAATAERIDPVTAEMSLLVADDLHGLGLGSLLVEHVAAHSRVHGIRHLIAEVLWENTTMLDVLRHSGYPITRIDEGSLVRIDLLTSVPAKSYDRCGECVAGP